MPRLARTVRSGGAWRKGPPPRRTTPVRRGRRSSSRHISFPKIRGVVIKRLILFFFVAAVAGAAFLTFAIASLSRNLPEPGRLIERAVPISTKIYDREGKVVLYDIHGNAKRTPVALGNIAPLAIKATIVAEDRTFYTHGGFALKGMLRSLLLDVFTGGPLRGGSTITQQFVKNAVLTNEKTFTRKLKELVLAYRIEKRFSKDEILEMYFNEIPYGSTTYGIEAASQTFFNKPAKDLDLIEGAILASLPKAPTRLSPFGNHTDELSSRAKYIIRGMVDEGYISKADADKALAIDPISRVKAKQENILAAHFVMYVKEKLVEKYGEDFVQSGGLKVFTTLDWRLQQIAEEEVRNGAQKNEKTYKGKNAALVAEDPKTGQILAMVGSRDYFDTAVDGNVNVALRPRQPGSSFKPIVYAAAFTKGFTPDTPLWDTVTTFKVEPKEYTPTNYDSKEHGLLTVRQALAGSLNVPAVKTLYLTGVDHVLDIADALGYSTLSDRSRFGLSLTLGGGEVTLLDHVGAFATFAHDGSRVPQSAILRIEDSSGRVLEQWEQPPETRVLEPTIVRELITILTDNEARTYIFGAHSPLILKDRLVAAKTGTTNDWRDGWTMGFTPSLTVGVWAGNNNNDAMKRGADGVLVAAPIWNAFMTRALKDTPVETFPKPDPRPVLNPYLRGQGAGVVKLKVDKVTGLLANEFTPPGDVEERTYGAVHSELFYLDRNNLNGPPPVNPGGDPNFENFETAVRRYAEEHGIRAEPPPTEYDPAPGTAPSDAPPTTP